MNEAENLNMHDQGEIKATKMSPLRLTCSLALPSSHMDRKWRRFLRFQCSYPPRKPDPVMVLSLASWIRNSSSDGEWAGVLASSFSQCVLVTQSCPTLCNPVDCSPPGSSVHGILQARILEWVAIPFSRGSSQPRDWTGISCIADGLFTSWATREALLHPEPWLYRASHLFTLLTSLTLTWIHLLPIEILFEILPDLEWHSVFWSPFFKLIYSQFLQHWLYFSLDNQCLLPCIISCIFLGICIYSQQHWQCLKL